VAGSILHATGTRRMNLLGGLAGAMPRTATAACLGGLALSAMPPMNGFISEWLLYRGFLDGVASRDGAGFAAAIAALALAGGLAVAAVVRLCATIFLGSARTEATARAHEAPGAMLVPMGILTASCAAIGVFPTLVEPALGSVTGLIGGEAA